MRLAPLGSGGGLLGVLGALLLLIAGTLSAPSALKPGDAGESTYLADNERERCHATASTLSPWRHALLWSWVKGAEVALGSRTSDPSNGVTSRDGDWLGGGGWSAWNDTKYFWLSDVEPTEFFPEDEGFIRIAPKAPQAPRAKDHAKTQRRDGLATPPPAAAEAKIPSRHGRQLLDVSEEDSNPRRFVESDLLGWEGSGEGSGDGDT